MEGSSNYAFVIIFNKNYRKISFRKKFERILFKLGNEFRRGTSGGGNQLRQPYLKKHIKINKLNINNFPKTDIIHNYGYYIGNYPNLSKSKILKICNIQQY